MFQLVVISEIAADEPEDAGEAAVVAADDGAVAAEVVAGGVDVEELELLEQADIAARSTRPSAGAK